MKTFAMVGILVLTLIGCGGGQDATTDAVTVDERVSARQVERALVFWSLLTVSGTKPDVDWDVSCTETTDSKDFWPGQSFRCEKDIWPKRTFIEVDCLFADRCHIDLFGFKVSGSLNLAPKEG